MAGFRCRGAHRGYGGARQRGGGRQRGGQWQQVEWNQALEYVANGLKAIKAEPRETRSVQQCLQGERIRIEAAIPRGAHIVALDERGRRLDTMALAQLMTQWQLQAQDVAVLIGGADGLEPALRAQAHDCLRLSDLTLPHALARLMLVEQLYRAWSINAQHPYHRA